MTLLGRGVPTILVPLISSGRGVAFLHQRETSPLTAPTSRASGFARGLTGYGNKSDYLFLK
jgi:hypothetical protein